MQYAVSLEHLVLSFAYGGLLFLFLYNRRWHLAYKSKYENAMSSVKQLDSDSKTWLQKHTLLANENRDYLMGTVLCTVVDGPFVGKKFRLPDGIVTIELLLETKPGRRTLAIYGRELNAVRLGLEGIYEQVEAVDLNEDEEDD